MNWGEQDGIRWENIYSISIFNAVDMHASFVTYRWNERHKKPNKIGILTDLSVYMHKHETEYRK